MSSDLKRSIRKYYLYHFFDSLVFFSPVIVLFWRSNGLSMTQVMLLQSIYSIGVIVLDVPTGAFADRYGKKASIILGSLFWTLGLLWYGASHTFWQFVLGELVVGTGSAFTSGADRSYVYGLLRANKGERSFQRVEGTARGVQQMAQASASVVGSVIGAISLGMTLTATAVSMFFGFITASVLTPVSEGSHANRLSYAQILRRSLRIVRENKLVGWYTVFFASFMGLIFPLNFYTQPLLQAREVPVVLFGVVYLLYNSITAIISMFTHQLQERLKGLIFPCITLASLIAVLIVSRTQDIFIFILLWHIPFTSILINQTVISDAVLRLVPESQAATVLSLQSLLRRFIYVIAGPVLGLMHDTLGLQSALSSYMIVVSLGIMIFLVLRNSITQSVTQDQVRS